MSDLYSRIGHVADRLTSEGHDETSSRLTEMVAAGATGNEILMGVRHVLSQFSETHATLPQDLLAEVNDVTLRINRALRD